MKLLKKKFLPIHYAMVGFSLTISNSQIFICTIINKIIYIFTRKKDTKLQKFFERQKDSPESLLLVTLYIVTIISLVNIFVPKNSFEQANKVEIFTYQNVSTIDNDTTNENSGGQGNSTTYNANVDFDSLISTNSDTIAYIIVKGTNISYPVVQTDNNDYYLDHDFNHNYSIKGSIFADYRNTFDNLSLNTIIYGHHRLDNTMFGPLDKLFNESYYQNNTNQIMLITKDKTYTFNIFSVYEIDPEVYYLTTSFVSDEAYVNFLNTLKSRSIYNINETLDKNSKIITLSTCNTDNTGRLVVHAKLVGES